MATTGTYAFAPSTGELITAAYRRVQVHRPEITVAHIADAVMECNLMQSEWSNGGPLLWTVDQQTVALVQGTGTYSVPANTVMILDAWISIANAGGTSNDRIITPLSRTEYASQPDKTQRGSPTSFWFDRLISPTITMWPVPDGNDTYTLNYYRFTQPQDVAVQGASNPQIMYLCLDAYVAGLAHRLARIYKPEIEQVRSTDAKIAFDRMMNQLVENVPMSIMPDVSSYYR